MEHPLISNQYERIIKLANEGIWTLDANNLTDFINERGAAILGYEPEEMLGRPVTDFTFPENKEEIERVPGTNRRAEVESYEIRARRKDGSAIWVLSSTSPILGDDGSYQGALAMFTDITDRKRAEEALRESEEKFAKAFHGSAASTFITRLSDGKIIEANDPGLKSLGYARDEVIGRTTSGLQLWMTDQDRQGVVDELKRTGSINNMELLLRKKNGEVWTALYSGQILTINGEEVMLSSLLDITDRKRAEEALRESEERFRTLSEASFEGIVVHDDGTVLEVNQSILDQTGYAREETIGRSLLEFFPPEAGPLIQEAWRQEVTEPFEAQLLNRSGELRMVQIQARAMDYKGRKARVATIIDVTERKRFEEELKRSNAELQQFAYVASHDLKEPLRMVTSYLGLLEKKSGSAMDRTSFEYLHYAKDGADRMAGMIDDLLIYARVVSRGKSFTAVSMEEVLATVLKDLKVSIEESGASITHDSLPTVKVDKSQMVMLLVNLVGNAIKYRGEEAPQIHISAHGKNREWVFSVRDNGIGIDPRHRDRLFQMFQRLHTSEEYEGTGIGLAIAKRIVERHGGRIWFESEEGKGATFFFTIPSK
jgi:PAS domain S-box-containing protein